MGREFSAGGVLVRRLRGRWWLAAIRPQGRKPDGLGAAEGLVDPARPPPRRPLREVAEETGVSAGSTRSSATSATSTRARGERIFKVVSFYLLRYRRGRIGELPPGMEREVAEARWLPLDEAPRLLAYRGEREMAERSRPGGALYDPPALVRHVRPQLLLAARRRPAAATRKTATIRLGDKSASTRRG